MSFKDNDAIINTPSPRYWLLWPGVLMMFVFSFLEIGMSSRHMLVELFRASKDIGPAIKRIFIKGPQYTPEGDNDPAPYEDRVKNSWWQAGVIFSVIISCALMATQFDVGVYVALSHARGHLNLIGMLLAASRFCPSSSPSSSRSSAFSLLGIPTLTPPR